MDPMEAIKATFFQECEELLADLEAGLLALSNGEGDGETINAVFRAVHSVKGGAGAFGLEDLVGFAHVFETLLDELRSERIACGEEVLHTLLRASDVLADHVQAAKGAGPRVDEARSAAMVSELEAWIRGEGGAAMEAPVAPASVAAPPVALEPVADEFGFTPVVFSFDDPAPAVAGGSWEVTFRPKGQMYAKANEAALLLRELGRLGQTSVSLDESAVPLLDQLTPEEGCLAWIVTIDDSVPEEAIREVFEFVEGDCDIEVAAAPAAAEVTAGADAGAGAGAGEVDIAALLAAAASAPVAQPPAFVAAAPAVAPAAPAPAPVAPAPAPVAVAPAPIAPAPSAPEAAPAGAAAAAPAPSTAAAPQATIRVDLERVDRLINVVGELVIQQAMLSQRVIESGLARSSGIAMGLEDLELLTREIQDSVMAIRAQPVKSVFQRMPRLVREVADMTGKKARLVTEGENTEVDKTVIERLSDPITHMLRNAIDHGLESPEERVAAGKPAEGTVRLAALHRSGRIVIEVSDDGKGINRQRVRQIAINKGLIEADAALTDDEVDNLIFLPGFSTAETISNVSGRGVGMDVVKRSIQALGGRISITSRPGEGSTFTMSLPLTLAVLDGMVVAAAEQTLVAPLSSIVESLTPRAQDVHYVGGRDAVISFRDVFVPLIDVGQALGFRSAPIPPESGVAVIIEADGGGRAALLVDAIQGQRQVVIKSLEANYQQVEGVAAATILGDGRVALILDVDALVCTPRRRSPRTDLRMAG